jgi:predicted hotdog family 3-hydroxylacyl-ACP dehydratase
MFNFGQEMNKKIFPVEDYLLQRERMMLINTIVDVNGQRSIALSLTTESWPLFDNDCISPIVIIELVAQTAGISIRWEEVMQTDQPKKGEGGGFIVGVKDAVFFVHRIPLNETIITCSTKKYTYMNYAEYQGFSQIGNNKLGEVTIQIFRMD